jgi:hypothetical protein
MKVVTPSQIGVLLILGLVLAVPAAAQSAQVEALREGNRLFREGRVEEAYSAYLAGHDDADPHAVLSYNLGTAAHHLDRLPEAILWYRRAAELNPGDPWLQENLEMARNTLGLQPYAEPGLVGAASRHTAMVYYLAAIIAWVGTALWFARPRGRLLGPALVVTVGVVIYGGALLASHLAPVAGVVTTTCSAPTGDLPSGSEVWIVGGSIETVDVAAGGSVLRCPTDSVTPIRPTS